MELGARAAILLEDENRPRRACIAGVWVSRRGVDTPARHTYNDGMTNTQERLASRTAEIAAEMGAAGLDSTAARMYAEREFVDQAAARDERRIEGKVS